MIVRSLHKALLTLALFTALAGSSRASSLTIDLPLVSGVATLTGMPGQDIIVDATITVGSSDSPLVIDDSSIRETTNSGTAVVFDSTVFSDPSNPFYNAEDPTTTPLQPGTMTTGGLVTIEFPTGAPAGISDIYYTVTYNGNSAFTGMFEVDTVLSSAPEPAYTGVIALALGLFWLRVKRSSSPVRAVK